MVVVIPLVPNSLGGSPEQWEARLLDYGAGERLQGTIESLSQDTTPQLGGNLDLNGALIVSGAQSILEWTGTVLNILGNPVFLANVGSPADGHTLRYNSGTTQWVNALLTSTDVSFNDSVSTIGETDVQGAIDYLVANGGGGGGGTGIASIFEDKSPQLGGILQLGHPDESSRDIQDHKGATMLSWGVVLNAVNSIQINNSLTGLPPTIRAQGSDTDVDLQLSGKGAGKVKIAAADLQLGSQTVYGDSGNRAFDVTDAADGNRLDLVSLGTGSAPILRSVGDDSNVSLKLVTKGTGIIQDGNAAEITGTYETNIQGELNAVAQAGSVAGLGTAFQSTPTGSEFVVDLAADDVSVPIDGWYSIGVYWGISKPDTAFTFGLIRPQIQAGTATIWSYMTNVQMFGVVGGRVGNVTMMAHTNLNAGKKVRIVLKGGTTDLTTSRLRIVIRRVSGKI
tara:strand:- start:352 stop:1707 length:1356 start_codon:yes stop_codon:yes gene_type:complete